MKCRYNKWLIALAWVVLYTGCDGPVQHYSTTGNHISYIDSLTDPGHVKMDDSGRYFRLVDSVYRLIKRPSDADLWQKYLNIWRYCYFKKQDFAKCLLYTDSMLQLAAAGEKGEQNTDLYAKSLLMRGDVLLAQKQYEQAFTWYYRAREAVFETKDSCAFADYTIRLASISYLQQKYLVAAAYYKAALADQPKCAEKNAVAQFSDRQGQLDDVGVCYIKAGVLDSADAYFKAALQYIAENEARFAAKVEFIATAKAVIWGNMADVEAAKGNDSAAERLLRAGININRLPAHAPEDAVFSRTKLAKLYLKQSRLPEARQVLYDCSIALDTIPNNTLKARLYQLSALYASAMGHPADAYAWLTRYAQFKDSLAGLSGSILTADINTQYAMLDRNAQLLLLQQKSEAQALYIILLAGGIIMGSAIIMLVWKNSRQSKKHIVALTGTLKSLEKSQQDNSRLLKIVAHDLRNPIGAITSLAALLVEETDQNPTLQKQLGLMHASGKNALELIDDLLQLHPAAKSLMAGPVDLQQLLQYCIALLQYKAAQKKQQILLPQPAAVAIQGDNEMLWRVFSNIIGNAIKFSPQGGVITVRLKTQGQKALVEVEDKGVGIPPGLQQNIFEISHETKRKGTAGEPSFGLGLLICRQIVELHKGEIWFASEVGNGTTFYVELPFGASG